MNSQTPLPPRAKEALEVLRSPVEKAGGELSRERIHSLLAAEFDDSSAEALVETLYKRGYVYFVDDHVRITQ
ncbi:hypothetical protein ACNS7O_16910 (plasmid) [Haloferacaceae archaeon DSL9]